MTVSQTYSAGVGGSGVGGAGTVYSGSSPEVPDVATVWNSADVGSMGVGFLSNGDLTVINEGVNAQWDSIRATESDSTGKRYYECLGAGADDAGAGYRFYGVGKATATLSSFVGADANGWGWQATKTGPLRFNNSASAAYGNVCQETDVVGVLVDFDAGTLTFFKNGVSQGVAYNTGIAGQTLFPMAGSYSGSTGNGSGVTARFARSSWEYGEEDYKQWGE